MIPAQRLPWPEEPRSVAATAVAALVEDCCQPPAAMGAVQTVGDVPRDVIAVRLRAVGVRRCGGEAERPGECDGEPYENAPHLHATEFRTEYGGARVFH
jgi:hypothetical protein